MTGEYVGNPSDARVGCAPESGTMCRGKQTRSPPRSAQPGSSNSRLTAVSTVCAKGDTERVGERREYSLAWHLATLCLALILPVLFLATWLAWSYAGTERGRVEEAALDEARMITAASDRELAGLMAATEVLALSRQLQMGNVEGFDAQARDVYRRLGINVVLRDRTSQQLVNTRLPRDAPLPVNVEDSDRIVLETKKPVISDLFIGAVTRRPLFIVNVPVFRDGEVAYFLNLSLQPDRVQDIIDSAPPPAGWTTTMVDGRGRIIARTNSHEAVVGQQLPQAIWDRIKDQGGPVGENVVDAPEGPILLASSRSQLSGWRTVVSVPAALVSAPLRHTMMGLVSIVIILSALAGFLALLFSRRIAQPVGALAVGAVRLGRGEALAPLATSIREVNLLGAALFDASVQRRVAEAALRESEQRYRALASATREGIAIHTKWRLIEANEAFGTMFGCSGGKEAVARPLSFIAAEARRPLLNKLRLGSAEPIETIGQRRDGTTVPVEVSTQPIIYRGCPMQVTVLRDLSAQKLAESALRESEARLRLAQLAGGVGTWDLDLVHGTAVCSDAYYRLYGLDPNGPGHRSVEDWLVQVHPDDREHVMAGRRAALVSGRLENEYRIVRPDGSVRWIVDRGVPIFDAEGRLVRLLGANVDVTEIRKADERLRELQSQLLHASRLSAMGQMAAALAHELNQPLGAATNFLNAARLALAGGRPDAATRALDRVQKAAEQTVRAGAILRRLRDFIARGEADKRIVGARRLVQDAVALAVIGARDPELRTRLEFEPESPPAVLVDVIQIQQVVFNLVKNALEATEGRSPREIVVSTRHAGPEEVEISVADSGPGLPANQTLLFQPFASTKPSGLGVGLSICRSIVEAHGGRLWAEPRPGGGAIFRFTLPVADNGVGNDQ